MWKLSAEALAGTSGARRVKAGFVDGDSRKNESHSAAVERRMTLARRESQRVRVVGVPVVVVRVVGVPVVVVPVAAVPVVVVRVVVVPVVVVPIAVIRVAASPGNSRLAGRCGLGYLARELTTPPARVSSRASIPREPGLP